MKRFVTIITLLAVLSVFSSPAWSNPYFLQAEPAMTTQFGWNLEPNDMLTVEYDLNHNGRPDESGGAKEKCVKKCFHWAFGH